MVVADIKGEISPPCEAMPSLQFPYCWKASSLKNQAPKQISRMIPQQVVADMGMKIK